MQVHCSLDQNIDSTYLSRVGDALLKVDIGYTSLHHEMRNNEFRPTPASVMRYRGTQASAKTSTAAAALWIVVENSAVEVGANYGDADMDVTIFRRHHFQSAEFELLYSSFARYQHASNGPLCKLTEHKL